MALGRQRERQTDMLVSWEELPRSPGHAFYDKLQVVLIASEFDRFVETQCASEYAPRCGRPSLPPGSIGALRSTPASCSGSSSTSGVAVQPGDNCGGLRIFREGTGCLTQCPAYCRE